MAHPWFVRAGTPETLAIGKRFQSLDDPGADLVVAFAAFASNAYVSIEINLEQSSLRPVSEAGSKTGPHTAATKKAEGAIAVKPLRPLE